MTSGRTATFGENLVNLATVEVDGRLFALDASQVREVVRWQAVTPLPRSPDLIEGVVDLRGRVIPVVDLGRALGARPVDGGPRARIAVVEVDGMILGLAADAAREILSVPASRLEDPPALATQSGYEVTRAVVRRPDAPPVLVLSLESLLESVYRSVLPSEEVRP